MTVQDSGNSMPGSARSLDGSSTEAWNNVAAEGKAESENANVPADDKQGLILSILGLKKGTEVICVSDPDRKIWEVIGAAYSPLMSDWAVVGLKPGKDNDKTQPLWVPAYEVAKAERDYFARQHHKHLRSDVKTSLDVDRSFD